MFELIDNQVIVQPDKLALPFFKVIWDNDKSKSKDLAFKELSYIFYMVDYKSPYLVYPEEQRTEELIRDIIKDNKWKPSKEVKEAIVKYKDLTKTVSSELLESVKSLLYRLKGYFDTIEFDEKATDPEFEMKKAEAAQKGIANVAKSIESLAQLEERVRKEVTTSTKRRGDQQTALFEE
mgnify:CR=1 FL=1